MGTRKWMLGWVGAALALPAVAQVPIGPFVGQHGEGFDGPEQPVFTACLGYRVFDSTADACTPGGVGCHTTAQQFFACLISARSAPFFFSSIDGAVELSFDHEVQRFGGWFGTNTFFPDATVDFLDAGGALLGSVIAPFPADCQWHWQGWDLGTASQVRRIVVRGSPIFTEGFIDLDDLQVDYVGGTPIPYCTSGTTSSGCAATISANGNPDVAHSAPCQVVASGAEGQRSGLVFYGVAGPVAAPWCAGGSSILCVKAPTQRTQVQSTGGTPGGCDGTLVLDWNAYHAAHPFALGAPWTAHESACLQAWFRDPPSCKATSLSSALRLTYLP